MPRVIKLNKRLAGQKYWGQIFLFLTTVGCGLLAVHRAFQSEFDPDLFWHIAQGRQLLANFSLPVTDSFSIGHFGEVVASATWMFDFLSAQIYLKYGILGLQSVKALIFLLSIALMLTLPRLGVSYWSVAIGIGLLTVGMVEKFFFRPDTLGIPLILISLIFYYRLSNRFSPRLYGVWILLLIFWTNWHASAVYGFVIVGALLFNMWINVFQKRQALATTLAFTIAALLASQLTYHMSNPILAILKLSPYMKETITEYQPLTFLDLDSVAISGFALGLISGLVGISRGRYGTPIIVMVFMFAAFHAGRMLPVYYIVMSVVSARELSDAYRSKVFAKLNTNVRAATLVLCVAFYLLPLWRSYSFMRIPTTTKLVASRLPTDFDEALKRLPVGTRIFNDHDIGGYLTLLSPQSRIWIDGRTNILYSENDLRHYNRLTIFPDEFKSIAKNIDWVIGYHKQDSNNLVLMAILTGEFSVKWLSPYFVGLSCSAPYLVTPTVLLYYPHCYKDLSPAVIQADYSRVSQLQESKLIVEVLDLLNTMRALPRGKSEVTLKKLAIQYQSNPTALRVIASAAEEKEYFQLASDILNINSQRIVWDSLKFAQWQMRLGHYDLANVSFVTMPELGYFSRSQLAEFSRLHNESMRAMNGITEFPKERLEAFNRISSRPGEFTGNWEDPKCATLIERIASLNKKKGAWKRPL